MNPSFLIQQSPRLSLKEAESILDGILEYLGVETRHRDKRKLTLSKTSEGKVEFKKYWELTNEIRKYGICLFFQSKIDADDPVFNQTFGLSTPNSGFKIEVEWGSYKKEFKTPCRTIPSEADLSDDIEFYKEECCIESSEHDFEMLSRNYRGYLFSSIALIDCYINRHILYFDNLKDKLPDFLSLRASRNSEERIELFVRICCDFPFNDLKSSVFWNDFRKLKEVRNEMIHSINPYMGFEIEELAKNLNLSINGVGGLLKKLQEGQRRYSLGFIEKVRTSPVIHFNRITIRSDGNHKSDIHKNRTIR